MEDSAQDIKKALDDKDFVEITSRPEDAHLIINVVGRSFAQGEYRSVLVRFEAGGKVGTVALSDIPYDWKAKGMGHGNIRTHSYSENTPYWEYEAWGSGSYTQAAKTVAGMIENLAKQDYLKLP